jgi:ATP synthase mitochondrial F1 complex assembly factor 2
MERATYTTKSFIVALALVKRHLTADQAAEAAQVEVNSQIERWGEVEDCESSEHRRPFGFPRPHNSASGLL